MSDLPIDEMDEPGDVFAIGADPRFYEVVITYTQQPDLVGMVVRRDGVEFRIALPASVTEVVAGYREQRERPFIVADAGGNTRYPTIDEGLTALASCANGAELWHSSRRLAKLMDGRIELSEFGKTF